MPASSHIQEKPRYIQDPRYLRKNNYPKPLSGHPKHRPRSVAGLGASSNNLLDRSAVRAVDLEIPVGAHITKHHTHIRPAELEFGVGVGRAAVGASGMSGIDRESGKQKGDLREELAEIACLDLDTTHLAIELASYVV
jgi:hypothetical protein